MQYNTQNESGQTILEMLAVLGIIGMLTIWGLWGYQSIVNHYQAKQLYEDIMVQAESNRGKNFRGKSMYDSGIGNRTRSGFLMNVTPTKETFTVAVSAVSTGICSYLNNQSWNDAIRIKINNKFYLPKEIDCQFLNESFDLSVIFPKKTNAEKSFPRVCYNCLACERCNETTHTCESICEGELICHTNGNCVYPCPEGKYLLGNECRDCPNGTCAGCQNSTKPDWDGDNCICNENSCNTGSICDVSGECIPCSNVANYKADGSETTDGQICCPSGYTSAVDGTCCKETDLYCKKVNYLQSSGIQYIDTGWYATTKILEVDMKFTPLSSMAYSSVSGSENTSYSEARWLFTFYGQGRSEQQYLLIGSWNNVAGSSYYISTPLNTEIIVNCKYNNGTTTCLSNQGNNWTHIQSGDNITNHHQNLNLFQNYSSQKSSIKMYYYKIYDNESLVRDFIPVIDKGGKAGMYDKVNGQMYYDPNGNKFSAG